MRSAVCGLVFCALLVGCEGPTAVPRLEIQVRVVDNGVASEFKRVALVTSEDVIEVEDVAFQIASRSSDQGVAFGSGCFLLQSSAPMARRRFSTQLSVRRSRSLFEQERGFVGRDELIPLVAPAYDFSGLGAPAPELGFFDFVELEQVASQFGVNGVEDQVVQITCSVRDIPSSEGRPLSVSVLGAGTVRLSSPESPTCSSDDERACHSLVDGPTLLRLQRLQGADERTPLIDVQVSGADCIERSRQVVGGGIVVVEVEPGACEVDFGEPTWTVQLQSTGLDIQPLEFGGFTPVPAGELRWRVPNTVSEVRFQALERGMPQAVEVTGAEGCPGRSSSSGEFSIERASQATSSIVCRVVREGQDPVSLVLGDSTLPVRVERLGQQDVVTCVSGAQNDDFGPCRTQDGAELEPDDEIPFEPEEFARIVALAPRASFSCSSEEPTQTSDGFPSVVVQLPEEGRRSCRIAAPPPLPTFPVLEFYLPRTVGTVRVSEEASGYEEVVTGSEGLIRLEQVPYGTLKVELLPAGYPTNSFSVEAGLVPLSDSRTGGIEPDPSFAIPGVGLREVPCTSGEFVESVVGEPGTYLLDVPGLVSVQNEANPEARASSATARVTCAALFECAVGASFGPTVSLTVLDSAGVAFSAPFDCSGGTCQLTDPDPATQDDGVDGVQIFLPSPLTIGIEAEADVDGRALDAFVPTAVPNGRSLEGFPSAQLFGPSVMAMNGMAERLQLGVETELPESLTPAVSDTIITARTRVCRDGTLEDLVLSAIARRKP